jgi:hypothetical protein
VSTWFTIIGSGVVSAVLVQVTTIWRESRGRTDEHGHQRDQARREHQRLALEAVQDAARAFRTACYAYRAQLQASGNGAVPPSTVSDFDNALAALTVAKARVFAETPIQALVAWNLYVEQIARNDEASSVEVEGHLWEALNDSIGDSLDDSF